MNIALLMLLLYFVLEVCILHGFKKRTIRKSNTIIVNFNIILEFVKKMKNMFTYIHLLPYDMSFYLRNVRYFKE